MRFDVYCSAYFAIGAYRPPRPALLSGSGTALTLLQTDVTNTWWIFVSLRWISGIIGSLGLIYMTFLTLRVPNTQSATGILYAATIVVFIGELTARVLADNVLYPL